MVLGSFEPCSPLAAAAMIFAYAGDEPAPPNVRRQSGRYQPAARKHANRVLMLGRLRELALYRAEVLRHHGFQVLTPETEEEAVDIIRKGVFDVAVLSYTLPDTTIQRFAELVRQHCPDCRILAIAQTMHVDRRIAPDSVVLGDKGPAELVTALRKMLSS